MPSLWGGEMFIPIPERQFQKRNVRKTLCKMFIMYQDIKNTSKTTSEKLVDINLRSVHAAISSGGGLTLLRTFCSSMDLPTTNSYSTLFKIFESDTEIGHGNV